MFFFFFFLAKEVLLYKNLSNRPYSKTDITNQRKSLKMIALIIKKQQYRRLLGEEIENGSKNSETSYGHFPMRPYCIK